MQDDTGTGVPGPDDSALDEARVPSGALGGLPAGEPARPLPVPRPETGEFRVDAALSLLDDLTELPVTEHPAMFEQVHARLSEVLGELGSGAGRRLAGPPGRDGS
ncbi:MAG: hypothetical protein ACRDNZ_18580 [Streptosporangiaceae bacterium]